MCRARSGAAGWCRKGKAPSGGPTSYFGKGNNAKENRPVRNVRTGSRNDDGRKRLPLFLFLLCSRLLCLLRRLFLGRFLGGFFLGFLGGRLLRRSLLSRTLRSGPRRGLFFLRLFLLALGLFLRDHELFFLGFNDLFRVSAELVLLQRRHLVLFVKMIFIEIHSFLPWGNHLKFWAPPVLIRSGTAYCLARSYRIQNAKSSMCGERG